MQKLGNRKWVFFSTLLVLYIFSIEVFFVMNEPWAADYWEHRAVLNELTRNISNPSHPIVSSRAPHAFFSPYMIGLAAIARFFSMAPLTVLNAVSIFNIGFFLFSLWLLSNLFFKQYGGTRSFFFLTLVILFYWGVLPPYFSSFYHFIALPYIAAYPSTFSFSCSVVSVYFFEMLLNEKHNRIRFIFIAITIMVFNWIVIITHPLTFIFTSSMYLFFLSKYMLNIRENMAQQGFCMLSKISLLVFIPLFSSFFWPYFPVRDLMDGVKVQHIFHIESEVLYQSLFRSYFPMLIPLALLTINFLKRRREAIPWIFVIGFLLAIYLYGLLTKQFGFGRCVSFLVIWLHIYFLHQVMNLRRTRLKRMVVIVSFIIALPFFVISNKIILVTAFERQPTYLENEKFTKKQLTSLIVRKLEGVSKNFRDGDVVLAEEVIGKYLPAFGAKIIANPYTGYWLTDNQERKNDLSLFFAENTKTVERSLILEKYRPDYLLITPATKQLTQELSDYFDLTASIKNGDYYLIKLKYARN